MNFRPEITSKAVLTVAKNLPLISGELLLGWDTAPVEIGEADQAYGVRVEMDAEGLRDFEIFLPQPSWTISGGTVEGPIPGGGSLKVDGAGETIDLYPIKFLAVRVLDGKSVDLEVDGGTIGLLRELFWAPPGTRNLRIPYEGSEPVVVEILVVGEKGPAFATITPPSLEVEAIEEPYVLGDLELTLNAGTYTREPFPLEYVWKRNGTVIPAASLATYTLLELHELVGFVLEDGDAITCEVTAWDPASQTNAIIQTTASHVVTGFDPGVSPP